MKVERTLICLDLVSPRLKPKVGIGWGHGSASCTAPDGRRARLASPAPRRRNGELEAVHTSSTSPLSPFLDEPWCVDDPSRTS